MKPAHTQMFVAKKANKEQIGRFYKLPDILLEKILFMSSVPILGTIMVPSGDVRTEYKTGFFQVIEGVLEVGVTERTEDSIIFHKIFDLSVPVDSEAHDWTGIVIPRTQQVNKFALRAGKDLILVRMPYDFIDVLTKKEQFKQSIYEVQKRTLQQLMTSLSINGKAIPRKHIFLLAEAFISFLKDIQMRGTEKDVEFLIDLFSEMVGRIFSEKMRAPDSFSKSDGIQEIFNTLIHKGSEKLYSKP